MSRPRGFPTAYQRIVENAKKGKGVVLSWREVHQMSTDDAIDQLASHDDEDEDEEEAKDEEKASS